MRILEIFWGKKSKKPFLTASFYNKDIYHLYKGFSEVGHEALLVINNPSCESEDNIICLENPREIPSVLKDFSPDLVVVFSLGTAIRLDEFLKEVTSRYYTVIKMDSNGMVYPYSSKLNILRMSYYIKHPLSLKAIYYLSYFGPLIRQRKYAKKVMEIIDRVHYAVIESEYGEWYLKASACHFEMCQLLKKIKTIYSPISPIFTRYSEKELTKKENIIVSVGYWCRDLPKNPQLLFESLSLALKDQSSWKGVVIGPCSEKYYKSLDESAKRRLQVYSELSQEEIVEFLRNSKIFVSSSRWESAHLAALEALSMGLSLASTPVPPHMSYVNSGRFGTISPDHNYKGLAVAIINEIELWNTGFRNPIEIARYFRGRVDRKEVAYKMITMITESLV